MTAEQDYTEFLARKQARAAQVLANARFLAVETVSGRGLLRPDPGGVWHVFAALPRDDELGTALLDALARSRTDLSVTEARALDDGTWDARGRELMRRFRFRTQGAVYRETAMLWARSEQDGPIVLTPSRKARGAAWEPNGNPPLDIPSGAPPAEVGAAVRAALLLCGGFDFTLFEHAR